MITSSTNRDSFHALNPNSNLNANPTYIYIKVTRPLSRTISKKMSVQYVNSCFKHITNGKDGPIKYQDLFKCNG